MSPLSTARRIAWWAVITALVTTLLVLGGITLVDHYVQGPRSERIQEAVNQSKDNGRDLAEQAARSCDFYIATADALATLATSPDLTVEQRTAVLRMQQVARTCRSEEDG